MQGCVLRKKYSGVVQRIRKANYKLFRRRLFVTVGFILVMYAVTVMRSAALVSAGNHLIALQTQESHESGPQQHLCKSRQSIGYS